MGFPSLEVFNWRFAIIKSGGNFRDISLDASLEGDVHMLKNVI